MPEFVDTNILVYVHDTSSGAKRALAHELSERLWAARTGWLSIQVLQEFYSVVTTRTRVGMSPEAATTRVVELSKWNVFAPRSGDVLAAIAVHREARISFWDAMIVHAAAASGCAILWTEDLAHGTTLRGVRILNPFHAEA